MRYVAVWLALLVSAAVMGQPTLQNGSAEVAGAAAARVDGEFGKFAAAGGPGAAVAIYRQGRIIYTKGYGTADVEHGVSITPQTVFNLASVSKQFTAYSIVWLARAGKLDLEDDVHKYLPALGHFGHKVTLAELLHHTSGVRDYLGLGELSVYDDFALVRQAQVEQLMGRQTGLNFVPGSRYEYSNTGYALLADVVAAVSGQSLRDFTSEHIFKPLGMSHTRLRDALDEIIPDSAVGYMKDRTGHGWVRALYNRETVGAGNVMSTVEDLGKWMAFVAHPPASEAALIAQMSSTSRLTDGRVLNYGMGLEQRMVAGRRAIVHTGGISGFAAMFAWYPAEDFGAIFVGNRSLPLQPVLADLAAIYLGPASNVPPEPAAVPWTAEQLSTLPGSYLSDARQMLVLERKGDKIVGHTAADDLGTLNVWADGTFGFESYEHERLQVASGSPGKGAVLEEIDARMHTGPTGLRYRKVVPQVPLTNAALQALVGDYWCPELDKTYHLGLDHGALTLTTLWIPTPQPLVAAGTDRFDASHGPLDDLSVSVRRDAHGAVNGLVFHYSGVASLSLVRR